MKKLLFFSAFTFAALFSMAQNLGLNDFYAITSLSSPKYDEYISERGFVPSGKEYIGDTLINFYRFRRIISEPGKLNTSINRMVGWYNLKGESLFTYQTDLQSEFLQLREQVKKEGFKCYARSDSAVNSRTLYQKEDMSVDAYVKDTDSSKLYTFEVKRKFLPRLKSIRFAEDLLQFSSHEHLAYVFGEKNVKKDVYFFSENELAKCSVLFLNTDRQVVFLWEDGDNNCTLSNLLIGGQQMLKSSMEHGEFVGQNSWRTKNGLHAGMTLYELRMMNGQDFKFYSGNSDRTGMVLPDNTGRVNFEHQGIILGCMNCRDSKFLSSTEMSAEEAISEQRILFVLSIILTPIAAPQQRP